MEKVINEILKDRPYVAALAIVAILAVADFFADLTGALALTCVILLSAIIRIAVLKIKLNDVETSFQRLKTQLNTTEDEPQ